jgi:hypothetical protein
VLGVVRGALGDEAWILLPRIKDLTGLTSIHAVESHNGLRKLTRVYNLITGACATA